MWIRPRRPFDCSMRRALICNAASLYLRVALCNESACCSTGPGLLYSPDASCDAASAALLCCTSLLHFSAALTSETRQTAQTLRTGASSCTRIRAVCKDSHESRRCSGNSEISLEGKIASCDKDIQREQYICIRKLSSVKISSEDRR